MKINIIRKFSIIFLVITAIAAICGCNTIRGIGTDIKRGGQAIEGLGR